MRKKLNIRADEDLVRQAKSLGINISRLTEKALIDCIQRSKWEYMGVQHATIQTEMQQTQNERKSANPLDNELGRRLGRNPPSVLGDIHLVGIPAPQAELTGAYYPFHGVSGHFTLTINLLNASASSSTIDGGFFLRPCSASQPTSHDATLPPRGWSFLRPITYRARSRSPTRRPVVYQSSAIIKHYGRQSCILMV